MPAAAVIQRVRALIGITGRKAHVGGLSKSGVKSPGSTWELHSKLPCSEYGRGGGISGVAVKCVDIGRNISGEGGFLDQY